MNNSVHNNKLTLPTQEKILRLRNLLSQVSSASFAFSKINRDYPLDNLDEENGLAVISFYENLIKSTLTALENYREESKL